MTKQESEEKVIELQSRLTLLELDTKLLKSNLSETTKRLSDINKPSIDMATAGKMYQIILRSFDDFDIQDYEPEYEFELTYGGVVSVSNVDFGSLDVLLDQLYDRLLEEFNVTNIEQNND
jgi:hypothetical protein